MKRIYIVFYDGDYATEFVGAFSALCVAKSHARGRGYFVCEYVLNEDTQEFEEVEE